MFRTKLDFTNRQVRQFEKTDMSISGKTVFGLPYSALTSGPDPTTSGTSSYTINLTGSTFSGNTGTTVWTFSDSRMVLAEGDLVPFTNINSGTTQTAGPILTGNTPFVTEDGYNAFLDYTGTTYTLDVVTMNDLGGGAFSGTLTSDLTILSAGTLDWTGSTIWVDVSGITRTDDLIIEGLISVDLSTNADGKVIETPSDGRLKTNIKSLKSPLETILNLRGVSYEWTEASRMGAGKTKFGFIAQEVQEVIPEMVTKLAKQKNMLTLDYKEIIPWLVGAVQELGGTKSVSEDNLIIKTQTIAAEDNNIELNYNGTHETAVGGGITVLNAVKDGVHSEIKTDENGRWIISPALATPKLSLSEGTPTSSNDKIGETGDVIWDNDYIYIKTKNSGWKRTNLESF